MKYLDYIFAGFGFKSFHEAWISTFGFTFPVIKWTAVFGTLAAWVNELFGFNHDFLIAYVILLLFEWLTGILVSHKKGERHSSRKLGRMLLKIAVYLVPIYILNKFSQNTEFPVLMGYELNPFTWLYWVYMLGVVWQLVVSLLENMDGLGFKFAKILIKIINKKFYENLKIEEEKELGN